MIQEIGIGFAQQIIAVIGVPIGTAFLFYMLKPILVWIIPLNFVTYDIPLILPLFPYQAVFGFCTGFLLSKRYSEFKQNVVTGYAWVLPALWLALALTMWRPIEKIDVSRWHFFFLNGTYFARRFQLITTLPFIASLAYSIGGLVARRNFKK